MLSLILLAVSATFSWIIINKPVRVDDVRLYVADTIDLALKSGDEGEDGVNVKLDENFRLQPVIGNGVDFYSARFGNVEVGDGEYVYGQLGGYDRLTEEQTKLSVLKFDFSFIVNGYMDLYIEHTDYAETKTFVSMGTGSEERKSPYGDFSRDNINGAVRVALLQGDQVLFIWIPNTDVELIKNDGKYSVVTGSQAIVEQKFSFVKSYNEKTGNIQTVDVPTYYERNGYAVIDGITYIWGDITDENCPVIARIYGEKKYSIVMWVDGTDRECDNALIGGKVRLNMCFTGQEIETQGSYNVK